MALTGRPPSLARALRAIAEVQFLTVVNVSLRGAGRWLAALAGLATAALVLGLVVPAAGVSALIGYALAHHEVDAAVTAASFVFAGAPVAAALLSVMSGSRALDWERLKVYPVAPPALFVAEVLASCFDLVVAVTLVVPTCFSAGVLVARPDLGVALLPTLVACLGACLALRAIALVVAGWLVNRLQLAFVVGVVTLTAPALLLATNPGEAAHAVPMPTDPSGAWAWLKWPLALVQADRLGPFLLGLFGPLAVPAALLALAYWLAFREGTTRERVVVARPEKLWSYRSTLVMLARQTVASLWTSDLGRLQVLTPTLLGLPFVLLRARLAATVSGDLAYLLVWCAGPVFLLSVFFNQFGQDRGAIKALLLLPVRPRDLLWGRALGLGAVLAANLLVLFPVGAAVTRPSWGALVNGPLAGLALTLAALSVGQFLSLLWPRPLPRKGLTQSSPGVLVALVSFALSLGVSAPVLVAGWLLQGRPLVLFALLATLVAALGSVYFGTSTLAERFLVARREALVETLS